MVLKNENGLYGQPPNQWQGKEYFFLRSDKAYRQIRYADILYCESLPSGYCRVVTRQETYLHNNTLKALQHFLPCNRFCRIHSGFIVGIDHIAWFHEKSLSLHAPDSSYKKGFAQRTGFTIGIRYVRSMRAHLMAAPSMKGGYAIRTAKLQQEMVLEEMEMQD